MALPAVACYMLLAIVASSSLAIRGEVLSEEAAKIIVDVAWQKYVAFVDKEPQPVRADSMVRCSGGDSAYSCEVEGRFELPQSLTESVYAYFKTKTAERAHFLEWTYRTVDNRLNLFLERLVSAKFELHFPLKKVDQLLEEVLVSSLE